MAGKAKRNGGGEITMSDIARHAGVSPMTVSRALSDPTSVSEKMRRKVDAAVRQFGYLPNRIAGSLSSKRSNVVGLVVPSGLTFNPDGQCITTPWRRSSSPRRPPLNDFRALLILDGAVTTSPER